MSVFTYSQSVPIKTITIAVKKDGEEIKRLVSEVNSYEAKDYTFDFKNDPGIDLEKDSLYEYTVMQDYEFYGKTAYAVGQFYTGSDCYATVYMIRRNNPKYVFRSECIKGLNIGDRFLYTAPVTCGQGEKMMYVVDEKVKEEAPEYEIECLSENPQENVIRIWYIDDVNCGDGADFGGVYIRDAATGEVLDDYILTIYCWDDISREETYIPRDVRKVKDKYYMYDAKRTGKTYIMRPSKRFYANIFDVYYKSCSIPGDTTSITVQYMDTSTDRQIKTETISDQKIGNGYEYLPVNTFSDGTYQYTYCAEDTRNELKLEKLWTNPENNVLTVYYKAVSANADITANDKAVSKEQPKNITNPIKKAKPAIKKISRKNKTAIKLTFGKIKKAQESGFKCP